MLIGFCMAKKESKVSQSIKNEILKEQNVTGRYLIL